MALKRSESLHSAPMRKPAKKKLSAAPLKKAVKPSKPKGKSAEQMFEGNKKRLYGIEVDQQTLDDAEERGGRRERAKLTVEKKTEFVNLLRDEGLTVVDAAKRIGFDRTVTLYEHRKNDTEFAAAWDQAWKDGVTVLEREAQRRACLGASEPVFYKGEVVGVVQKYSDILLIFLMKARSPEKYRDKVDITNSDNSIATAFAEAVRRSAS